MIFDARERRLVVSDRDGGKVHSVSLPDGRRKTLTEGAGYVTALASAEEGIYFGSEGRLFLLRRQANSGRANAERIESVRHKIISGLVVDSSGYLWIADAKSHLIQGL